MIEKMTNGVNRSVPSLREYDYETVCGAIAAADRPDYFIIPNGKVGVIKNQYDVAGCASEVAACFAQEFNKIATGEDEEFSEGFIYGKLRKANEKGPGMAVPTLLDEWRKIGAIPKKYLNHLLEMPAMQKIVEAAPELLDIAKNYKLGGSVSLNYAMKEKREQAICDALIKYGYGLFGVSYDYFGECHAILIIGYNFKDKNKKKYIVQNSWGTEWGDNGIGEVPQSAINEVYLLTYNPIEVSFDDVPKDRWSYKSIRNVVLSGLMNGVSEKEFGPEEPMTREQFAVVMDRYSKLVDSRIETAVNLLRKEIECRKEG